MKDLIVVIEEKQVYILLLLSPSVFIHLFHLIIIIVQIVNYAKYFARQTALLHDSAADVTDYFDKTFSMIPPKTTPTLDSAAVIGK